MGDSLPYIDEHTIRISAPPAAVRAALERYAAATARADRPVLARLLGTKPRSGFAIATGTPREQLSLEGRHRFARYRLTFALSDDGAGGTTLRAVTYARFPGLRGRLYRALIIGSRGHALAMRRILRSIERLAPADRPG
jgi:hypothetical protein